MSFRRNKVTEKLRIDSSPRFTRLRMTVHFLLCHSEATKRLRRVISNPARRDEKCYFDPDVFNRERNDKRYFLEVILKLTALG
jgi:hypothetical protein